MKKDVPLPDIDREIVARAPNSLYEFIKMAWPHIETADYKDNWHIPLMCEYLMAVSRGELLRLVINVPPGTMKSLTTSVFWPVWEWIQRGATKWMFASYDASLVGTVQGGKVIDLMQTRWFVERWGNLLKDKAPAASMFETSGGGFRFATSPGGKGTGRHVDIQVVDDPNKPQDVQGTQAFTKKAIGNTSMWFKGTASTRSVDAASFRRIIVMQRLHEDDLAGEMLRERGWEHLCLPMRYEKHSVCVCENPGCSPFDPRTEDGELLWEERFPEPVVKHQETIGMGPSVAAAQYQQRPTPASGGVFQNDWFRYWHHDQGVRTPIDDKFPCRDQYCKVLPDLSNGALYQSWDMAFKKTDGTDFIAGGLWFYSNPNAYLIHQVCARMTFIETCAAVIEMTNRWPKCATKWIEDKANGPAAEDVLKSKVRGIVLVNPEGGKLTRAHACSGLFQAGNVYIPHPSIAPWVPSYRTQLVTFPRGVNDDMVDQTTQALIRLKPQFPLIDAMKAVKAQQQQ